MGRLKEAEKVFKDLIVTFPTSVKYEASRYRISEISFLYREKALLDLLRWNYEEYLRLAEDLQRIRIESYSASKDNLEEAQQAKAQSQYQEQLLQMQALSRYQEQLLQMKERLLNLIEEYEDDLMELDDYGG